VTQRSRESCWWFSVSDGPAQEIGRESEGKEKGPAGLRPNEKRERENGPTGMIGPIGRIGGREGGKNFFFF
jgi:hypothetical protein